MSEDLCKQCTEPVAQSGETARIQGYFCSSLCVDAWALKSLERFEQLGHVVVAAEAARKELHDDCMECSPMANYHCPHHEPLRRALSGLVEPTPPPNVSHVEGYRCGCELCGGKKDWSFRLREWWRG